MQAARVVNYAEEGPQHSVDMGSVSKDEDDGDEEASSVGTTSSTSSSDIELVQFPNVTSL